MLHSDRTDTQLHRVIKGACKSANEGRAGGDKAHAGFTPPLLPEPRRLLAHMLRRRHDASFKQRGESTSGGPAGVWRLPLFWELIKWKNNTLHHPPHAQCGPPTSPSRSIFHTLGASLSLFFFFHRCNAFLCFLLRLLFSYFKAPLRLWLRRFSALSLDHWPFSVMVFYFLYLTVLLFSTQVCISKVPQVKKKKKNVKKKIQTVASVSHGSDNRVWNQGRVWLNGEIHTEQLQG